MSTSPINFDDLGAKPAPVPAAQANAPAVDFSDLGAKQVSASTDVNNTQHEQTKPELSLLDKAGSLIRAGEEFQNDVSSGFLKGAGQTVNTISKGISKVAPSIVKPSNVEGMEQIEDLNGAGEHIGAGIETLGEFVLGDEALKGLSLAARFGIAQKVAKLAETSPRLAKALEIGLRALRTGSVADVQGMAHGQSPGEAAVSGLTAAGIGAGTDATIEGVRKLAPKLKQIAGKMIPTRAGESDILADIMENLAPSKVLQKFEIENTQPAAKEAIGNVATDVRKEAVSKVASDTNDFKQAMLEETKPRYRAHVGEDGETTFERIAPKPFEELTPAEQKAVLKRAQELKQARLNMPAAADLEDAASQIKQQSQGIYKRLDELTKGSEQTFSDLQDAERRAWRKNDVDTALKARAEQDAVIKQYANQFDPKDLQNARANWRTASALERVHDRLNIKSIVQPTPEEFRPKGVPDPGIIRGKAFSAQIHKLASDGLLQEAGLSAKHIQSLQDLSTLLENQQNVKRLGRLFTGKNAAIAEGLGLIVHPATAVTAAKVGLPAYAMSQFLGKVMTDPVAARNVINFLKVGRAVAPAVGSQMMRTAMEGSRSSLGGQ